MELNLPARVRPHEVFDASSAAAYDSWASGDWLCMTNIPKFHPQRRKRKGGRILNITNGWSIFFFG